ncbi:MAG TPA: FAD-dependent thymidylate synthase [Candidatus Thermoplasmatota archaeon]|nr:FAD-dependent thymidylate synthase [Candidatus Thermoplasmatota archaeon]
MKSGTGTADAPLVTGEPIVKLLAFTDQPFGISVASARTCYSPTLRFASESTPEQRERIGKSIYEAGHHTPFQHPTFVFGLENVSRQFVWSFLHSHPFYNSEQSSQRYVVLHEAKVHVPPLSGEARSVYEQAVLQAWRAYADLSRILDRDTRRIQAPLSRIKGQNEKQIAKEAEKKAIETARYVVPVAAFTSMYHTVSGIELKRYVRMANSGDCPTETRAIVAKMADEVRRVDPDFFLVGDDALPEGDVVENRAIVPPDPEFAARFDRELGEGCAKLVAFDPNAETILAQAVREVLGASPAELSDDAALALALDPAKNPHLLDTLNAWTHSPILRALSHVNYTFRKKISHAADSQDQRHRTVPASRPLLTRVHTREPDYITPEIVARNPEAKRVYDATMRALWDAKNRLLDLGVPAEFACYLLPNATAVRYTQTGSLLHLLHKWRMRTCFLAQMEIYQASMEEIAQVAAVHPRLTSHIGPPCYFRKGFASLHKELEGPCPEGPRWCGIRVWNNFPKVRRPI